MFNRFQRVVALAALAAFSAAGCAHAGDGYRRGEVLAELPENAPPGECYARVRAPDAAPPPALQGAHWVMTPGPYGSPGPIWCLIPTGPAPAPAAAIERYGWIRVLCDQDATPDRIREVQRRLHERGYYRGGFSGRYDAATAAAVTRFQSGARIEHGGYLSLETLQALDARDGSAASSAGYAYGYSSGYAQQSAYEASSYGYGYGASAPVSPCLQACAYPPQPAPFVQPALPCCMAPPPPPPPPPRPCCVTVQPVQPCCYGGAGYGYGYSAGSYWGGPLPQAYGRPVPAYASGMSAVQNGWLTWQGKSTY